MKEQTTKSLIIGTVLCSLLLMVALTQPWLVDRSMYESARAWVMGVSGLVGMVVIVWQVVLGFRGGLIGKNLDKKWLNKLHRYMGIGTVMALIFHPLAAMISYGTFALDELWMPVGKLSLDVFLVLCVIYLIARKMLSYKGSTWFHVLLYPIFIGIRGHAWSSGSMIAELPGIKGYRIILGGVLIGSSIIKIVYEINHRIHKYQSKETTIIHFAPLTS